MLYNWQRADWPEFRFDPRGVEGELLAFLDQAGQVGGLLRALPEGLRQEAVADVLITEAIKTSAIEGEFLSRPDVVSSVRNQLGLNAKQALVRDVASASAAEFEVKVRESWDRPLSEALLFDWHSTLFQGARLHEIGAWRTHSEPMRVISPRIDAPVVHFEAPPSSQVPTEMARFIVWFNRSRHEIRQPPLRSALVPCNK